MADIYSEQRVRGIVREETADLRSDMGDVKSHLDKVEGRLDGIDTRLDGIDIRLGSVEKGLYRLEVLLEDMYSEMRAFAEVASIGLGLKPRTDDHEARIADLEAGQSLLTTTVRSHARQLKRRG